jgi:hypothetical protein
MKQSQIAGDIARISFKESVMGVSKISSVDNTDVDRIFSMTPATVLCILAVFRPTDFDFV